LLLFEEGSDVDASDRCVSSNQETDRLFIVWLASFVSGIRYTWRTQDDNDDNFSTINGRNWSRAIISSVITGSAFGIIVFIAQYGLCSVSSNTGIVTLRALRAAEATSLDPLALRAWRKKTQYCVTDINRLTIWAAAQILVHSGSSGRAN